jgi:outer membrane protein
MLMLPLLKFRFSALLLSAGLGAIALMPIGAAAQDAPEPTPAHTPEAIDKISDVDNGKKPTRTRVYLGPQWGPAYPGADRSSVGPFIDVSRARDGEFFAFEAPDEGFGFNVIEKNGSAIGVTANLQGKRKRSDTNGFLPSVGTSVELGVAAQTWLIPSVRLRGEVRKAVSGHKAFVANISADYVAQHGDDWLISVGPRITLADGKYHRRYYDVRASEAVPLSGLTPYRAKAGLHSVGAAASALYQLTDQWGLAAYAKYERLVGDAASSPVTREYGSRNQPSAGLAVSYTFSSK